MNNGMTNKKRNSSEKIIFNNIFIDIFPEFNTKLNKKKNLIIKRLHIYFIFMTLIFVIIGLFKGGNYWQVPSICLVLNIYYLINYINQNKKCKL